MSAAGRITGWQRKQISLLPTVTNMFNRDNAPTLPTLETVCKAFGITLAQFFSEGNGTDTLTEEQRALFAKWSTLSDDQKKVLFDLMNTM